MGLVSAQLYDEKRLSVLTIIDAYNRECLAIYADISIKGEKIANTLRDIGLNKGLPRKVKVDYGQEFTSRSLMEWAVCNNILLEHSTLGSLTYFSHMESFIRRLLKECLNANRFMSLKDAREKIENWRKGYNESRLYSN